MLRGILSQQIKKFCAKSCFNLFRWRQFSRKIVSNPKMQWDIKIFLNVSIDICLFKQWWRKGLECTSSFDSSSRGKKLKCLRLLYTLKDYPYTCGRFFLCITATPLIQSFHSSFCNFLLSNWIQKNSGGGIIWTLVGGGEAKTNKMNP